jgi:mono/diheme cytochrome c family protein
MRTLRSFTLVGLAALATACSNAPEASAPVAPEAALTDPVAMATPTDAAAVPTTPASVPATTPVPAATPTAVPTAMPSATPTATPSARPTPTPVPTPTKAPAPVASRPAATPPQVAAAAPAASAAGKALFNDWACGSCHALADAGASGSIGPALDRNSRLTRAYVTTIVTNGQGAMPSFGGQMTDAEIATLAGYIVAAKR